MLCICNVYGSVCAVRLSSSNALYAHSVDAIASASPYEEERLYESLEELKARIIVSLLPDEDDLLSGVTDDLVIPDSTRGEVDELDLFSSGGGFELEDDGNSSSREKNSEIIGGDRNSNSVVGENSSGEHVSRRLFVRNIDGDVENSALKALFVVCFLCPIVCIDYRRFKLKYVKWILSTVIIT